MRRRSAPVSVLLGAAVALSMLAAACGSSSAPGAVSNQPGDPAASLPAGGPPSMAAIGGGSCKVAISGGLSLSWESAQDVASLMVSYWLSPATHAALSPNGESFLMNCQGTGASISFYNTNGTTAAMFPEAAGSYVIPGHGDDAKPGTVTALFTTKDDSLWNISEPGTFGVAALDSKHFAGSFQFNLVKLGDDLKPTSTTAAVSGTFDFACTRSCK